MAQTLPTNEEPATPKKYALLIGLDYYGSREQLDLYGCVADITAAETYLRQYVGLTEISKLLSPHPNTEIAADPDLVRATRDNVVRAFKKIADDVSSGDFVYIHYAGHGGQIPTRFPSIKSNGKDEAFILVSDEPSDVTDRKVDYIRDVELAYLLMRIAEKRPAITLVLDCCHSGGATRGGRAARTMGSLDESKLVQRTLIEERDTLLRAWINPPSGRNGRGARAFRNWMSSCVGFEFLAACRSDQKANEIGNAPERHGLMTECLRKFVESNQDRLSTLSCEAVQCMVAREVKTYLEGHQGDNLWPQEVVFGGRGKRAFFGTDNIESPPTTVTNVEELPSGATRITVNAGAAHGVRDGDYFALYPADHQFRSAVDYNGYLALCGVTQVRDFESSLRPSRGLNVDETRAPVTDGCRAVNVRRFIFDRVMKPRRVRFAQEEGDFEAQSRVAIEGVIQRVGGLVEVASPDSADEAFFEVGRGQGESFVISFTPNPATGERATVEARSLSDLQTYLAHLAFYYNLLDLASSSPAGRNLSVEILGYIPKEYVPNDEDLEPPAAFPQGAEPRPQYYDHLRSFPSTGRAEVQDEDVLIARVTNGSTKPLYIEVLDLDPSWQASRVFPVTGESPILLSPNDQTDYPIRLVSASSVRGSHQPEDHDTLIFLGTVNPRPNFSSEILPALGQSGDTDHSSAIETGGNNDRAARGRPSHLFFARRFDVHVASPGQSVSGAPSSAVDQVNIPSAVVVGA
ncbi:hypothetical protein VTH82DRAFT_913 [Thermothelomyces myriococcoides]